MCAAEGSNLLLPVILSVAGDNTMTRLNLFGYIVPTAVVLQQKLPKVKVLKDKVSGSLAHLAYQPKSPFQCFVMHNCWCCWCHLCKPLLATGLNIETSYLVYMWHCVEHPALRVHHCHVTHVLLWPFWAILGRCALDVVRLKHVILFADVTSLNDAVMSYVTSQHHTCVGHVTIYYKRATNTSVGDSCPLFICLSRLTLSPETCMWHVSNTCRLRCI